MNRKNQNHGLWFEDKVRELYGAHGLGRFRAAFDVPGESNNEFDYPIQVKSVQHKRPVCLASAVAFSEIDHPHQLVIGQYRKTGHGLVFDTIHEVIVSRSMHNELLGGIPACVMRDFDAEIKYLCQNGTELDFAVAREYAIKRRDRLVKVYNPLVKLAYKINKENKRLQLTCDLDVLLQAHHQTFTETYRGKDLPLVYTEIDGE